MTTQLTRTVDFKRVLEFNSEKLQTSKYFFLNIELQTEITPILVEQNSISFVETWYTWYQKLTPTKIRDKCKRVRSKTVKTYKKEILKQNTGVWRHKNNNSSLLLKFGVSISHTAYFVQSLNSSNCLYKKKLVYSIAWIYNTNNLVYFTL